MYYFMYKYTEINLYEHKGFKNSLIQLGLCGLFLGLGAASKWICLYSAAGLAIIFFKDLYEKYNEYRLSILLDQYIAYLLRIKENVIPKNKSFWEKILD